jgi:DNA polymerase III subunit epsilon
MRQIVLDTETTGRSPSEDRIVEIGCVELIDGIPTESTYQQYINPERWMPRDAEAVHGLSGQFLKGYPKFADVVDEFLEFIGDAQLLMHNAPFDIGFLNAELRRCKREPIDKERVIDTLPMARAKDPGKQANLDALCKRAKIKANRDVHGALTDAKLLAEVYVWLNGGRQVGLEVEVVPEGLAALPGITPDEWVPRLVHPTEEEAAAHAAFIATIPNALWNRDAL